MVTWLAARRNGIAARTAAADSRVSFQAMPTTPCSGAAVAVGLGAINTGLPVSINAASINTKSGPHSSLPRPTTIRSAALPYSAIQSGSAPISLAHSPVIPLFLGCRRRRCAFCGQNACQASRGGLFPRVGVGFHLLQHRIDTGGHTTVTRGEPGDVATDIGTDVQRDKMRVRRRARRSMPWRTLPRSAGTAHGSKTTLGTETSVVVYPRPARDYPA